MSVRVHGLSTFLCRCLCFYFFKKVSIVVSSGCAKVLSLLTEVEKIVIGRDADIIIAHFPHCMNTGDKN